VRVDGSGEERRGEGDETGETAHQPASGVDACCSGGGVVEPLRLGEPPKLSGRHDNA
jgi:hypothetical protein